MAELHDGTEIIDSSVADKPVTNIAVKPDHHGGADVFLYHSLEETGDLVHKAEVVGHLHFDTLEHLTQFKDRIAKSIHDATKGGDITAPEFQEALTKATRKIDPEAPKA